MSEDTTQLAVTNGKTESELALQRQIENASLMSAANWFGGRSISLHNFGTDPEKILMYGSLATDGETIRGSEIVNSEIDVVHWFAHPITLEKEGGEMIDATRCVLFDKEDVAYHFVSDGVQAALARIASVKGYLPWIPPVRVKVRQITTSKKRRFLTIVPVFPAK